MYFSTLALAATSLLVSAVAASPMTAIAYVSSPGSSAITGTVRFVQDSSDSNTMVYVNVTGLPAGDHGIHVHQFGDLSGGCMSTGEHYNPYNRTHGGPTAKIRHVGDYGNLVAPAAGIATLKIDSDSSTLWGKNSFIGRAVVIHSGKDDLGLGGNAASLANGNSGVRIACGVIGILDL